MKKFYDDKSREHVGWMFSVGDCNVLNEILVGVKSNNPNQLDFLSKVKSFVSAREKVFLSCAQVEWLEHLLHNSGFMTLSEIFQILSPTLDWNGTSDGLSKWLMNHAAFMEGEYKLVYEHYGISSDFHVIEVQTNNGTPAIAFTDIRDVDFIKAELNTNQGVM